MIPCDILTLAETLNKIDVSRLKGKFFLLLLGGRFGKRFVKIDPSNEPPTVKCYRFMSLQIYGFWKFYWKFRLLESYVIGNSCYWKEIFEYRVVRQAMRRQL